MCNYLPETMDEVTLARLEGVLAEHPAFDGVKIAQMRKTPVGEGVGQMSAIARLDLGYDGKPGPASIVVKLHAPFQGMRDVGIRYEMYARENGLLSVARAGGDRLGADDLLRRMGPRARRATPW